MIRYISYMYVNSMSDVVDKKYKISVDTINNSFLIHSGIFIRILFVPFTDKTEAGADLV